MTLTRKEQTRVQVLNEVNEDKQLGRPKGSFAKEPELTGKETIVREPLERQVSHSAVARILGVNRGTLTAFVQRRHLGPQ